MDVAKTTGLGRRPYPGEKSVRELTLQTAYSRTNYSDTITTKDCLEDFISAELLSELVCGFNRIR